MTEWEPIKMFRCVQDPMIGPKPKQAFMLPDLPGWEAWFHVPSGTIYVVTSYGRRHLVGTGNWSGIELFKEGEHGPTQNHPGETAKEDAKKSSKPKLSSITVE